MIDLWNDSYVTPNPVRYGDETTYAMAENYLHGMVVADWGCGECRFETFHEGPYLGIDGSVAPINRYKADLRAYKGKSQGVLLRHVLEHNEDWRQILKNALEAATDTLVLIVFTPFQDKTGVIAPSGLPGVPDIGFSLEDLREILPKHTQEQLNIESPSTQYKIEHMFIVKQPKQRN